MTRLTPSFAAKRAYVAGARSASRLARETGLLAALEARAERRWAHWLRSLAAIHDLDEMVRLDVPWWTYAAIIEVAAFLEERPAARVFEYGSGASTVWLARRAASVTSIEHDPDWVGLVRTRLTGVGNVETVLVEPGPARPGAGFGSTKPGYRDKSFAAYVRAVETRPGPYELIVIDGRARPDCLRVARPHLAPGGLIVFDNTRRRSYRAALAASGGAVRHFPGLVPGLPYPDRTSLVSFAAPTP